MANLSHQYSPKHWENFCPEDKKPVTIYSYRCAHQNGNIVFSNVLFNLHDRIIITCKCRLILLTLCLRKNPSSLARTILLIITKKTFFDIALSSAISNV